MRWPRASVILIALLWPAPAKSETAQPTTAVAPASAAGTSTTTPATSISDKLPFIHLDLHNNQVRVDCEALNVDIPVEFVCVTAGGNQPESILRTHARPSNIHFALLALGLKPGAPMRYDETTHKWFPPTGPPLNISVEFDRGTERVHSPINKLI